MSCSVPETVLKVIPCEIQRLPIRIAKREWGAGREVSMCNCYLENDMTHTLGVVGICAVIAVVTGFWPIALICGAIILAKGYNIIMAPFRSAIKKLLGKE